MRYVIVRNMLTNPLAISNRTMVDGEYRSIDAGEPFHQMLKGGEEIAIEREYLGRRAYQIAFDGGFLTFVAWRFLDVSEEDGG